MARRRRAAAAPSPEPTLLEREHRGGLHGAFKPRDCAECWPNGAPALPPSSPDPEPVPTPALRPRDRGEGFEPLRGALERFRSRIKVDQVDPSPRDPNIADDGGPVCGMCASRRWLRRDVPPDHPLFGRLVECPDCREFLESRRAERFWRDLPPGFKRYTLESYPARSAEQRGNVVEVRQWLGDSGGPDGLPWLYLWGETGRGKTSLAVAAARERGGSAIFVTVPDLLVRLARTYDRDSGDRDQDKELDLLESLWNVSTLVLDDIGAEAPTPWAQQRIYQVINARADDPRAVTIITSNLHTTGLETHLRRVHRESGGRMVSRIAGRAEPYVIEVRGVDLRLRGQVRAV